MDEALVEERAGYCWRCWKPFTLGETITLVHDRFFWRSSYDGEIHHDFQARWGSMCPLCTSEDERASAPERMLCEGCSQPLATPSINLRTCSDRCARRWRRRRQAARRPFIACDGCANHAPRFPSRRLITGTTAAIPRGAPSRIWDPNRITHRRCGDFK